MEIVGISTINKFRRVHPAARNPLDEWMGKVTPVVWKTPVEVKRMFSTVSFVKNHTIFNIGGNKYRLLTEIRYKTGQILILQIGTHEEYDRWKL